MAWKSLISSNEMNQHLATAIIASMTTKGKPYPSRIPIHFQGKDELNLELLPKTKKLNIREPNPNFVVEIVTSVGTIYMTHILHGHLS